MYETYLMDADTFLILAREGAPDEGLQKRNYRADIFCVAGAVEAFIFFAGTILETKEGNGAIEVAFLMDRKFISRKGRFTMVDQLEFHRTEEKLKHLLLRGKTPVDLGSSTEWSDLAELRQLRDRITHPKEDSDTTECEQYDLVLSRAIRSAVTLLGVIAEDIVGKPLRPGLRSLPSST